MARINLEIARKTRQLSQKQLAEQAGISDRMYRYIERGEKYGSMQVWVKLSEILGKPIEFLIENNKGAEN